MTNKKIYVWACDYSKSTGEGNLANFFINDIKKKNYHIHLIKSNFLKNFHYITPFLGVMWCWYYYLKNFRVAYVNYLPLWNFLIFLTLPPATIIGPITGGSNFNEIKNLNFFIRKNIFPIFYNISCIFIRLRFKNIIFSTDLLKKYIPKKISKKSRFNYIFLNFKKSKKIKKNIDFLIYYKKHLNKINFFPYSFVKNLVKLNLKVHVIGDLLDIKNVKNHGLINNKKVKTFQKKSKYTIAYGDNIYSIFVLECLSNNMKIFVDRRYFKNISFEKKNFIKINYRKIQSLLK